MRDTPSTDDRPLKIGSLFSGYGGLDLVVEHATGGRTAWFSELNDPVARVFSHHWPHAPNLGDITTVRWNEIEPVDVLCGGFPCQDVSTVGKGAGLAPGTRSGLWSYMATAIEALRPRLVVIENVRGLLSAPATRAQRQGADDDRNPGDATPPSQPFATWNPEVGCWETSQLDLFGHSERYSAIWPTSGTTRNGSAYPHRWPAPHTTGSGSSSPRTARMLFRTPLASDSSRGGETLEQVRARRGTIALSHQIIDLALYGPAGSPARSSDPETLFALVESIFAAGGDTPTPSPDGSTSPDELPPPPRP